MQMTEEERRRVVELWKTKYDPHSPGWRDFTQAFWMWRSTIHLSRAVKCLERSGASNEIAVTLLELIGQIHRHGQKMRERLKL